MPMPLIFQQAAERRSARAPQVILGDAQLLLQRGDVVLEPAGVERIAGSRLQPRLAVGPETVEKAASTAPAGMLQAIEARATGR